MRTLLWSGQDTIDLLKKELRKGEVVLAQGDTVLGLLADISPHGVARLDYIKKRTKKPYLVLVGNRKKVVNLIKYDDKRLFQIEKLMDICWPGPVTLIFKANSKISSCIKSDDNTVAIRIPDHEPLLRLLEHFDGLFSTSANSTGEPVPCTIDGINSDIVSAINFVVLNNRENKDQSVVPSTIIDCTGNQLIVVRKGSFAIERLVEVFGKELFLIKEE